MSSEPFIQHMLASCGALGNTTNDPIVALARCAEVSPVSAYAILLYLVNGYVGTPTHFVVPPAYIKNIKTIAVVTPEALLAHGLTEEIERLGLPKPDVIDMTIRITEKKGDETVEKVINIKRPNIYAVVVIYDTERGEDARCLLFFATGSTYKYIEAPTTIKSRLIEIVKQHTETFVQEAPNYDICAQSPEKCPMFDVKIGYEKRQG